MSDCSLYASNGSYESDDDDLEWLFYSSDDSDEEISAEIPNNDSSKKGIIDIHIAISSPEMIYFALK